MKMGRGDYWTQCRGKTPYKTKGKAIERIHYQMGDRRRLKRSGKAYKEVRMEAYRCCYCGYWHVGGSYNWRAAGQRELEKRLAHYIDEALDRYV